MELRGLERRQAVEEAGLGELRVGRGFGKLDPMQSAKGSRERPWRRRGG